MPHHRNPVRHTLALNLGDRKNFRSRQTAWLFENVGGADRDRTDYLRSAIAALSQMSYGPLDNVSAANARMRFEGERGRRTR